MRIVLALLAFLFLAACGGDEGNVVTGPPVANATAPQGRNWVDVVEKTPEGGYRQGNPAAPIKLIEYGSRSCPVCGRFAQEGVEPLRRRYIASGTVSYEFREFFVHPQDPGIALLGHCVPTESFFPILDAMFAAQGEFNQRQAQVTDEMFQQVQAMPRQQQASTWATILGYVDFMKRNGVPEARVQQCLADTAMMTAFGEQLQRAVDQYQIPGTPTFLINGRVVPNVLAWAQLEPALQAAGAR